MKWITIIFILFALVLFLVGCSNTNSPQSKADSAIVYTPTQTPTQNISTPDAVNSAQTNIPSSNSSVQGKSVTQIVAEIASTPSLCKTCNSDVLESDGSYQIDYSCFNKTMDCLYAIAQNRINTGLKNIECDERGVNCLCLDAFPTYSEYELSKDTCEYELINKYNINNYASDKDVTISSAKILYSLPYFNLYVSGYTDGFGLTDAQRTDLADLYVKLHDLDRKYEYPPTNRNNILTQINTQYGTSIGKELWVTTDIKTKYPVIPVSVYVILYDETHKLRISEDLGRGYGIDTDQMTDIQKTIAFGKTNISEDSILDIIVCTSANLADYCTANCNMTQVQNDKNCAITQRTTLQIEDDRESFSPNTVAN